MMIAFNLAEPVLRCGCSQITPQTASLEQSTASLWNSTVIQWASTTITSFSPQAPPPGLGPHKVLPDLIPHSWETKLRVPSVDPHKSCSLSSSITIQNRAVLSGLPDVNGQVFRDKAAPTVPSPTKSQGISFQQSVERLLSSNEQRVQAGK